MDVDVETLVFDRYDIEPSLNIKGNERQRRGDSNLTTASHKIIGNRKVLNYKQFLKSGQNKALLIYFLSQYLQAKVPDVVAHDKTLVIAGGYPKPQTVNELSTAATREVEALALSHVEADTRMVLHAVHLAFFPRTIVRCDDTDVLVLLLYYQSEGLLSKHVRRSCRKICHPREIHSSDQNC